MYSHEEIDLFSTVMEARLKGEGTAYRRKIKPIRSAIELKEPTVVETRLPNGLVESTVEAQRGDWIITGVQGEQFVLTPDRMDYLYTVGSDGRHTPKERKIVALKNPFRSPVQIIAPWSTPEKVAYQTGSEECYLVAEVDATGALTADRYIIGDETLLLGNYEPFS